MGEPDNIEYLAHRLTSGTLAAELVAACRGVALPEDRAEAIHQVLQRRFDNLLATGPNDAEAQNG